MMARAWLLCGAALAGQAQAAEDTPPAQIVVTAPAGSDSVDLRDAPVNMAVLARDALDRQHPLSLADALNSALGSVTLSNGTGSPYQGDVSYRGFQATSSLGAPTGLSVWLDGVRLNEPFGSIVNWDLIPLNALRSVEVQPGANPLFGLNTLGGALVLGTKNGADDGGLAATLQTGSFARIGAQATAGGTMADRGLDWFVAGTYDDQAGWRWYTHTRVSQGYGKLRWHGTDAQAELGVIWADTSLDGTQGLPLSLLAMPQMAYTWPDNVSNGQVVINLKAAAQVAPTLRLSGNFYYRRSNSHSSNSNASLGDRCDGVTYDCSALAPGGTALDLYVTNPIMAGSAAAASFVPYTGPLSIHDYTSGINTTLVTGSVFQHTVGGNALLDFDGTLAGLRHDLNLGGSFEVSAIAYAQDTDLAQLVNYQTVPDTVNPLYGNDGNPLINAVAITSHTTAFDLFVRDMVRLGPTLSLTGSLAFTHTWLALGGSNTTLLGADGAFTWTGGDGSTYYNPAYLGAPSWNPVGGMLVAASAPAGALAGPEIDPVSGRHGYGRLNPSLGLAWNPRKDLGLFASYSEAMRAPTAIELACADPARPCALPTGFNGDPALPAVIAHSIELGARGTLLRRLTWNGALYRTLVTNDIQFIYGTSGLGYFAAVGKTERRGFELGLSADLGLAQLSANYGYVAATYRTGFVDANGDTVAPGAQITGIPRQSLKLRATLQPVRQVTLGATMMIVGSQYAHGDEANVDAPVPGYTLVNLDLHIRPAPRWDLFATVTNLFDTRYSTFGVWGGNIYSGATEQFRTPGQARALLAGVRYSFGAAGRD
jgi:outer membrane receptor protein involved in Fe transport